MTDTRQTTLQRVAACCTSTIGSTCEHRRVPYVTVQELVSALAAVLDSHPSGGDDYRHARALLDSLPDGDDPASSQHYIDTGARLVPGGDLPIDDSLAAADRVVSDLAALYVDPHAPINGGDLVEYVGELLIRADRAPCGQYRASDDTWCPLPHGHDGPHPYGATGGLDR